MAGRDVDLKDTEQVKEYLDNLGIEYRFGCYKENNPESCHLLGSYLEAIQKDFGQAFETFRTNCERNNHGHSCHRTGGYHSMGKACEENFELAYQYFVKACDLNYYDSCRNAGLYDSSDMLPPKRNGIGPGSGSGSGSGSGPRLKAEPADRLKALKFFKKACDDGNNADACNRYSVLHINGYKDKIQKDMSVAHEYAVRACSLGSIDACVNASVMYRRGDGTNKDEKVGIKFAKLAGEMMKQQSEEQPQVKFQGEQH